MPDEVPWPDSKDLVKVVPVLSATIEDMNYPEKIVEQRTPVHPCANTKEQEVMQALNTMWRRDFFLFIPELAYAEAWLQQCKKTFGKVYFLG